MLLNFIFLYAIASTPTTENIIALLDQSKKITTTDAMKSKEMNLDFVFNKTEKKYITENINVEATTLTFGIVSSYVFNRPDETSFKLRFSIKSIP